MADMDKPNVEGVLSFLDYLKEKHFLAANTVEGLKTAVKKVFEGVDGEAAATVDLTDIDLDSYLRRFQVAEGRNYKPDTIAVYGRRIRQAIDAQRTYIETGQVPQARPVGQKPAAKSGESRPAAKPKRAAAPVTAVDEQAELQREQLVKFPFPLRSGVMAEIHLPARGLDPKDADRMCAYIRALQFEEQRQLPRGEEELAA